MVDRKPASDKSITEQPLWRSLLYVPANNQRFIDKAHLRKADALILDLEDSVPPHERDSARHTLAESIRSVGRDSSDVLVRINSSEGVWQEDLDAAVVAGVRALVLPKVESSLDVQSRAEILLRLEEERSLQPDRIALHLLVESPGAIFRVAEIAACNNRVVGLGLGAEDFALAVGMQPDPETLSFPRQLALYAAKAAGISAIGLMGSITDFSDIEKMRQIAARSVRYGFDGSTCIHPDVVPILNAAFTPCASDVTQARRIVDAYDLACRRGVGAITVDGQMIDVPVAERSRRLLLRMDAITSKRSD